MCTACQVKSDRVRAGGVKDTVVARMGMGRKRVGLSVQRCLRRSAARVLFGTVLSVQRRRRAPDGAGRRSMSHTCSLESDASNIRKCRTAAREVYLSELHAPASQTGGSRPRVVRRRSPSSTEGRHEGKRDASRHACHVVVSVCVCVCVTDSIGARVRTCPPLKLNKSKFARTYVQ